MASNLLGDIETLLGKKIGEVRITTQDGELYLYTNWPPEIEMARDKSKPMGETMSSNVIKLSVLDTSVEIYLPSDNKPDDVYELLATGHAELNDTGFSGGEYDPLDGHIWVIARTAQGKPIGYLQVVYESDLEGLYVHEVYVGQPYREYGVFKAMMGAMATRFKELGLNIAFLEVHPDNEPMVNAMEKMGGEIAFVRYFVELESLL